VTFHARWFRRNGSDVRAGVFDGSPIHHTLADHQAPNGQIAKFIDLHRQEANFWYLGCSDSTLWWLIALAILDRHKQPRGLLRRYSKQIKLAIQWLLAQEHQRFFLLQQNEASD
jgi:hypothetical protein